MFLKIFEARNGRCSNQKRILLNQHFLVFQGWGAGQELCWADGQHYTDGVLSLPRRNTSFFLRLKVTDYYENLQNLSLSHATIYCRQSITRRDMH